MVDDSTPAREEVRAWIHKHLASAPERDEAWYRSVLNIYETGKKPEPLADQQECA